MQTVITVTLALSLIFLPIIGVNMATPTYYTIITPDGEQYVLNQPGVVVTLRIADGVGLPPISHKTHNVFNQPGGVLDHINIDPRIVTITTHLVDDTMTVNYIHTLRAALFDALRWNRVSGNPPAPSILRYTASGKSVDLHVYYQSDVTSIETDKVNVIGIRLIAYDPMWYAMAQTLTALNTGTSLAYSSIIARINGEWSNMAAGLNSDVLALATDGVNIYAGGTFLNAGGVADADYFAVWNGTAWAALGAVPLDAPVHAIAVGADGTIYIGGEFQNAGGDGNADYLAQWNGAAWVAVGAPALNQIVYSLALDASNNLYIGGMFTDVAGIADADFIAMWNGTTWAALGAAPLNSRVDAISVAGDGSVYAGGLFTDAGGAGAADYVAKWDGTDWTALGATALSDRVWALLSAPNGILYAAGEFIAAGGVTGADLIAGWNGASWLSFWTGGKSLATITDQALALARNQDGELYVGGYFVTLGGSPLIDRIGLWTGTAWEPLDMDLEAADIPYSLLADGADIYIGLHGVGVANISEATNVTTLGNAEAFPTIAVTGPCVLKRITNYTSGESLIFNNLSIADGETITIDLTPGAKTITSSWLGRPVLSNLLLPQSDIGTWSLKPAPIAPGGVNQISVFTTGIGGGSIGIGSGATISFYNTWLDVDGAVQ